MKSITFSMVCDNPISAFVDLRASLNGRDFIAEKAELSRGCQDIDSGALDDSVSEAVKSFTEECLYSLDGRVRYCGESMHANATMAGSAYAQGSVWALDGDIQVRTYLDMLLFRISDGTMAEEEVYRAIQELFFLIVTGLDQGVRPARRASHAAMYLETHWSSPPLCAMLFHRQPREFLTDLLRAYVSVNEIQICRRGASLYRQPLDDLIGLASSGKREWRSRNLARIERYIEADREGEQKRRFLTDIEAAPIIEALSAYNGQEVLSLLVRLTAPDHAARVYDFGEVGAALTGPIMIPWHTYQSSLSVTFERLYEAIKRGDK
ncbi:MAG: hypothetical protein H0W72_10200 [Planctomycetes bacterium]|nr:hypothetical protein [Planctomycetota bacterium]